MAVLTPEAFNPLGAADTLALSRGGADHIEIPHDKASVDPLTESL